jgi:hypothetical protein
MSATARRGAALRTRPSSPEHGPLTSAQLVWVLLVPCAAVAALVIALLGPPLGHALLGPGRDPLWPRGWWETEGRAEPVTQARYLLAALAPLLLVAAVRSASRRPVHVSRRVARAAALAGYGLVLALVTAALLRQHLLLAIGQPAPPIFGLRTVAAAVAFAVATALAMRGRAVMQRLKALARETTPRRVAGVTIAVAFAAIWLLKALLTDRLAEDGGYFNLPWTLNDAFAVLDGRTPLVDYHGIYAKLLPYPAALVLATFGTTTLVYTTFMVVLDALALLAVYATFRLVARSSLAAVTLFLPFVAVSDIDNRVIAGGSISPMTLSAMWPMRYGGAYLMAWLAARHVAGRAPRRRWVVFLAGGLVAINNLEFGAGAMLATLVALAVAQPPRSRPDAARLARDVAGGTLAAIVAVSLPTLLRAGALPKLSLLLEWPRIFTRLGWFSMPLPAIGLHLGIYATFVAAIATATARRMDRDEDRLLTAMLAWSGVFGLAAGGYLVGRPDAMKLAGMLSAWGFALMLLLIASTSPLAAQRWRRPSLARLLVLFGFGLAVCSLTRLSPPQQQIARLAKATPDATYRSGVERFVGARTRPGETVVLLVPMGHRIAYDLGLRNVSPYPFENAIVTRSQMRTLLDAIRREHVRAVFAPVPGGALANEGDAPPEHYAALAEAGFEPAVSDAGVAELTRR